MKKSDPIREVAAAATVLALLCGASYAHDLSALTQSSTFEIVAPVVPAVRTPDSNRLFLASFTPAVSRTGKALWPGHLVSVDLNADGTIPNPAVANWDAVSRLAYRSPSSRRVYTSSGGTRYEFSTASMTPAMLEVSTEAERDSVVDTVRSLGVGDISRSTPVLVGAPSRYYSDPSGPDARLGFADRYAKRKRVILAGDSDGMLHAFSAGNWDSSATPPGYDAGTGEEEWAYIPGFLLDKVKSFSRLPLVHQHYVGAPATVADIWIDSDVDHTNAKTENEWFTYLIGGSGQGGKGYFALDITNPDSISYPKVAWELTRTSAPYSTPYLGETWSAPAVGKIRKVTTVNGLEYGYDQWVAIVGAGKSGTAGSSNLAEPVDLSTVSDAYAVKVASTGDAPASGTVTLSVKAGDKAYTASGSYTSKTATQFGNVTFSGVTGQGRGIYPAQITDVSWTVSGIEGRAILVLDAATGQVLHTLTHSKMGQIVAPPTIVTDNHGYIERAYVGDLDGNIWRVGVDSIADFSLGGNPFFTVTRSGHNASIYMKAAVAKGSGPYPHWWIYFGTGDRENPMETGNGAIFGVFDDDVWSKKGTMSTVTRTENDLTQNNKLLGNPGDDTVILSIGANMKGWYAALPAKDEKMLANPTVFSNNLFFSTFAPSTRYSSVRGTARIYGFAVIGNNAHLGKFALHRTSSSVSPDTRRIDIADAGIPSNPLVSLNHSGSASLFLGTNGSTVRSLKIPPPAATKSLRYWKEIR